ncbi:MAG TPA: ABC transporter permease [Anaeromyxobacter sp.]|nr:ABC transporter permease [Anaeromyxobacter sp.]
MEALEAGQASNPGVELLKTIWRDYSILVVLGAIVVGCGILAPRFLNLGNLLIILLNASIVGTIALGMTIVIIAGGIDLSSGPVLATSGAVLILLQRLVHADGSAVVPLPVAILACLVVGTAFGFLNGIIVTRFNLPPFIVTLAVGYIARGLVMYFCRGATIMGNNFPGLLGNGRIFEVPIPFVIMLVMAIAFHVLLTRTKFGSYVFAVGGNENAARYSGIKVERIRIITYMLVGLCTAISAVIEMSRMAAVAAATSGNLYEFEAITAVVVGGTSLAGGKGRIVGTVVGAIILYIVLNMMIMLNISPYLSLAVKGAVILLAVLLQSRERA